MILKSGDLVRTINPERWYAEKVKWSTGGPIYLLGKHTILEFIEMNDNKIQRFWCPSINEFIAALTQDYNDGRFEKISL